MKTTWDYTNLAEAYLKRPDYSPAAIEELVRSAHLKKGDDVCDIGAGVAHLTLMLANRNFNVVAVEPNDAMRSLGKKRTLTFSNVAWFEGTGEQTGQSSGKFKLCTFGSSFNVVDRKKALEEVKRISIQNGWFACLWNHRDLTDPIQNEIETIIKSQIDGYNYGVRREDQYGFLVESNFLKDVKIIEGKVVHTQSVDDCIKAWESHATLERQAGPAFHSIINLIRAYLEKLQVKEIQIPYTTKIWAGELKS